MKQAYCPDVSPSIGKIKLSTLLLKLNREKGVQERLFFPFTERKK
jgi:hypothetical protein